MNPCTHSNHSNHSNPQIQTKPIPQPIHKNTNPFHISFQHKPHHRTLSLHHSIPHGRTNQSCCTQNCNSPNPKINHHQEHRHRSSPWTSITGHQSHIKPITTVTAPPPRFNIHSNPAPHPRRRSCSEPVPPFQAVRNQSAQPCPCPSPPCLHNTHCSSCNFGDAAVHR